jgi:hypothetical protein
MRHPENFASRLPFKMSNCAYVTEAPGGLSAGIAGGVSPEVLLRLALLGVSPSRPRRYICAKTQDPHTHSHTHIVVAYRADIRSTRQGACALASRVCRRPGGGIDKGVRCPSSSAGDFGALGSAVTLPVPHRETGGGTPDVGEALSIISESLPKGRQLKPPKTAGPTSIVAVACRPGSRGQLAQPPSAQPLTPCVRRVDTVRGYCLT